MLKEGQLARFKNPNADEITPGTGKSIIMKVLEVDAPRALVEFCTTALIRPTARVSMDALQRVFAAHPHIDIPDFLNTDEFTDESYGNDVTAHVVMQLPDDSPYELWVWVHPDDPADRESPDFKKYDVTVYDRVTGDLAQIIAPDELDSYGADDPDTAMACIEQAKQDIMTIILNGRENDGTATDPNYPTA